MNWTWTTRSTWNVICTFWALKRSWKKHAILLSGSVPSKMTCTWFCEFFPALADWTGTHFYVQTTYSASHFFVPSTEIGYCQCSRFWGFFCSCLNLHAAFTQPGALFSRSLYMLSVAFFYKTRLKGGFHKYCKRAQAEVVSKSRNQPTYQDLSWSL